MYSPPTLEYRNVIDIEYPPITVIVLEECNRDPDNAVIVHWNLGQAIDIDTGGVYEPFIFAWAFVRFRRQRASRHVECREPFDIAKFFSDPSRDMNVLGDSNPKNIVPSTKCGNMDFRMQPLSVPITMKSFIFFQFYQYPAIFLFTIERWPVPFNIFPVNLRIFAI